MTAALNSASGPGGPASRCKSSRSCHLRLSRRPVTRATRRAAAEWRGTAFRPYPKQRTIFATDSPTLGIARSARSSSGTSPSKSSEIAAAAARSASVACRLSPADSRFRARRWIRTERKWRGCRDDERLKPCFDVSHGGSLQSQLGGQYLPRIRTRPPPRVLRFAVVPVQKRATKARPSGRTLVQEERPRKSAAHGLPEHRRHCVPDLGETMTRLSREAERVRKRLKARSLSDRKRPMLLGMDVPIAILRDVSRDRAR